MTYAKSPKPGYRKPNPREIELLDWVAQGKEVIDLEVRLGLAFRGLSSRMGRLRRISGRDKLAAVVYWGLTEMHIHYPKQNRKPIKQTYLDVVALIAQDKSHRQIAHELCLSVTGVAYRVRKARALVGATNEAHLVAICWTEDWIS